MDIADFSQALSLAALVISLGSGIWTWLRAPSAALVKRFETFRELIEGLVQRNSLRIQNLESELTHLPKKEDLFVISNGLTAAATQLDGLVHSVRRIERYLREAA